MLNKACSNRGLLGWSVWNLSLFNRHCPADLVESCTDVQRCANLRLWLLLFDLGCLEDVGCHEWPESGIQKTFLLWLAHDQMAMAFASWLLFFIIAQGSDWLWLTVDCHCCSSFSYCGHRMSSFAVVAAVCVVLAVNMFTSVTMFHSLSYGTLFH